MIELPLVSEPGIDAEMQLRRDARQLVAPELLSIEVISALKKLRLRRVIGSDDARFHLKLFRSFTIEYYAHAPLLTSDRRLATACAGLISAEFFGDLTQTA